VESAISNPVCLLFSKAEISCVSCQLASRGVEKLFGELAMGEITQTKTKPTDKERVK